MKLQPREKRFLIGAALAAVLFALANFVVMPQLDKAESSSSSLFQAQKELRNSKELLAAKQLQDEEAILRNRLDEQNRRLLTALDANQAGAQFQTALAAAAAQQQLGLVRSEFLSPVPAGQKYLRIPVRLELTGRITQITQFLATITTGNQFASIEEIELNSNGDKEKKVHCGLVVAALMVKPK